MRAAAILLLSARAACYAPTRRQATPCAHPRRSVIRHAEQPDEDVQHIITCGSCKAVYPIDIATLGTGAGSKVKCEVCGNIWFQATARVNTLFDGFELKEYDAELAKEAIDKQKKRAQEAADRPPRKKGAATLFVANLPFRYSDQDVMDLFGEIAPITSAQVVMDDDGRSRGYGFVEIDVAADQDKLIEEFHGAEVSGRDLIVRPGKSGGDDPGGDRGGGRGGGRGRGRGRDGPFNGGGRGGGGRDGGRGRGRGDY